MSTPPHPTLQALEAKNVLRAAGIVKQGMKAAIPASYLRWLNTRVEKYMDKTTHMVAVNGQDLYGGNAGGEEEVDEPADAQED